MVLTAVLTSQRDNKGVCQCRTEHSGTNVCYLLILGLQAHKGRGFKHNLSRTELPDPHRPGWPPHVTTLSCFEDETFAADVCQVKRLTELKDGWQAEQIISLEREKPHTIVDLFSKAKL